jgi:hypothetical protein
MAPRKKPAIRVDIKPRSLNAILKLQSDTLNQLLAVNEELRDILKTIKPVTKIVVSPNLQKGIV